MVKRALISVSDKTGIVEFAQKLNDLGVSIISTGGTFKVLKEAGIPVINISDVTGFPECLDGRVKTLHPNIHAGLLAMRSNPEHMKQVEELNVELIDMVVVNLYPFKQTIMIIIIDCPPSLNMLTVNAMTTADTVLVPIQCEYYALEGLSQLIHTINLVQERLNPELQIEGVVFTMYDVRTNLSNQVVETVKENLDTKIYNTMIPRNIRLAEAPSYGIPINMYDSKSAGAESYRNLAKEIIARKDI